MSEEKKKADYMASLNRASKARKNRNRPPYEKYAAIAAAVCAAVVVTVAGGRAVAGLVRGVGEAAGQETDLSVSDTAEETRSEQEIQASLAESASAAAEEKRKADIAAVVDSYSNLGIVKVSGYLNIRQKPEAGANVIGKLPEDSACEVLETLDGWYHISSGGIDGYVSSQYVLTGDAAKEEAVQYVVDRAIVTADNLNVRTGPSTDSDVVGKVLQNERYEILGETDGWYQIASGYISADYADKVLCLNEARKLDLRAMVLNYYDRPGVSNVTSYLNIRDGASQDAKIIAKLPSYAGCEILDETDGWYKIRSGKITGYVSKEFILTGDPAREKAMEHAELMAVVSTDMLNARTEPSTDASIWTQISNNERYSVVSQLDGWVQIQFDESDDENGEPVTAYVSSEYVDVRYCLAEAIKFSPAEENASFRSRVVNYALQFLGNPYVWGGTSLTRGADCSGFTMSVLAHFGIYLPHYSGDQARQGTRITSGKMRPGDLIFYGNSRGTINHVAMYIGNGQIVHAASRKSGIKISTWNYRTPLRIVDVIGNRT